MAEPEELRSEGINNTQGPRNWRDETFFKKRKVVNPMLTYQEANDGWYRAFNKCQLAYDLKGRKYRTDIPRVLPNPDDLDIRRKKGVREDGEVY